MKFLSLTVTCLILLSSCKTKSVLNYYEVDTLESRHIHSQNIIKNRKSLIAETSLEQKADFFEKYILKRMHPTHKLAPKLYIDDKPGKLRMDMTALFLSSLAFKYAVTKDSKDKIKIINILQSIVNADKSNGLDGFIPYQMTIKDDKIFSSRNDTHINVYTQLLFAYIPLLEFSHDLDIRSLVFEHLKLIVNHLQKSNFTLVDHEGNEIDYSDLSPSRFTLQTNRQQLLLVITDLALKHGLGNNMQKLRDTLTDYGYEEDIQSMHFKFLNLEFPTHSSSWLNLTNSFIGYHINHAEYFKSSFKNLHKHYEDEQNLLYLLMWQSMSKETKSLDFAKVALGNFPVNPTSHEIINSTRKDIELVSNASYVKLKRELEVSSPLPVYQRPMRSFEWKLNQMRVDGNFKSQGTLNYTGIDYLVAYWMFRWLQIYKNGQI